MNYSAVNQYYDRDQFQRDLFDSMAHISRRIELGRGEGWICAETASWKAADRLVNYLRRLTKSATAWHFDIINRKPVHYLVGDCPNSETIKDHLRDGYTVEFAIGEINVGVRYFDVEM